MAEIFGFAREIFCDLSQIGNFPQQSFKSLKYMGCVSAKCDNPAQANTLAEMQVAT